ncbi:MAG TPA: VWA domain-containing protein [Vicinamibacterales bacterium]|nr:VWA domain-containing protein [Vicinamibacterales bacterium]
MKSLLAAVLSVAVLDTAAAQTPQTSPSPPPQTSPAPPPAQTLPTSDPLQGPTFRTGIDLVAVDVAVVDRNGRPVEDLRAAEFSVKVDGEVRRVVSAELVKIDVEAARKQVADKSETFYTSNLTPPNGRQIILAVDQMNIRPGSLRPIMAAASRFLDRLSPLDQVAFITYPEPGPRVNFTSDKLRLRLAMQGLIGQQPRTGPGQYNLGASEAIAIDQKRDQLTMAVVMARECRSSEPAQRAQCERDIVAESSQIARSVREDATLSMIGLRQVLERLTFVDGPKSLILISEGLAVDDSSELRSIVRLAGAARVSINVMLVDLRRGDVTVSEQPPTEVQDRRMQVQGLEALATMSRGSLFYIAGTGEPIFDRLASEISASYILGVEQRPSDSQGDRHRIDVEVRRRDVTIRSRQAFVLSPTLSAKKSPEDHLRDALTSPFGVSGLPVRVTTFAQQDPASEKVRLTVSAQVGQPGAPAAPFTVGYLVIDDANQVAANFVTKATLSPVAGSPNEPLHFVSGVLLQPGIYSLRFGVVDADGRRGSVVRDVNAWKMAGEPLAMGDLIVGNAPSPGQGVRAEVEPHVVNDRLAAYLELYSTSITTWDRATVTFEIADNPDSPALMSLPAQLAEGRQPTWRVATGIVAAQALPPGRYVARAQIAREGKNVGVLTRPFVLERAAGSRIVAPAAVAAASVSFASSLPKFDAAGALRGELLNPMLDIVEKRSPGLKAAIVEARAGRYGAAALEALTAGDQTVATFLRGIDLFAKGQLDQAATQLQLSAGPRREFFPAAFYLGACFASVGRDRDAAGVWQMALGTEPRPVTVYTMVADARLRDGQPASAIDVLKPAYDRDPANDEVARRLSVAYAMIGRYAEALPVAEAFLTRQPIDQDMLLVAIMSQYEVVRAGGRVLSNEDRARLRKYSAAYKGSQQALMTKYLATMEVK